MRRSLLGLMLLLGASSAIAGESYTYYRPDGSEQIVIPVTEQKCRVQEATNGSGAAVGAATGYAAGRLLVGRRAGLLGLAAGALIGANTNKQKSCFYEEVLVGHKVITIKNGKTTETFIPR